MIDESSPVGSVLVVEDEIELRVAYARVLGAAGLTVRTCGSAEQARDLLALGERFSVVLTDLAMPGMSGVEFLPIVRASDPDVAIVIATGRPSLQSTIAAVETGTFSYLVKPVLPAVLCKTICEAAARYRLAVLKRRAMEVCESPSWRSEAGATLEAEFEASLSGLFMVYQPIVKANGELFAHEALVRSSQGVLMSPDHLFAAAERLGRTRDLGRRIRSLISNRLEQMSSEALMFVNLHASELADQDLYTPNSGISRHASRVVLEITERKSLDGIGDVRGKIADLRALGYGIAVDDLGAGYAGLSCLNTVNPDIVKLDMSLIRDIDQLPRKQSLVASMIHVCQCELGMQVICEGVETIGERDVLVEAGAALLQGYLFGRPQKEPATRVGPEQMSGNLPVCDLEKERAVND